MSVETLQKRLEQQNEQLLNHESLTSGLANTTVELLEEVQNAEVDVRKGVESQLRSLQETLSRFIDNERAKEISRMIDGIHSSLATLRTTVTETVLGKEGEKKWYENIVGDGLAQLWDTVEKWKTSLAFSFGGAIETLKQTGDKEKKPGIKEWLLSFFFSSDEITLTKALKAHNFTSIDLKSGERLSNFILKVKSHYSAKEGDGKPTQLDFFLAVAEKARENTDGATVTLKQLEQFADAVKVSVPVQTKEAVPDQGIVRYLHEAIPHQEFLRGVMIDGIGRVRFSPTQNVLEVDGKQWKFKERKVRAVDWKNGSVFEVAYTDARSPDFLNKEKFTELLSLMKATTDGNITLAGAFTLEKVS